MFGHQDKINQILRGAETIKNMNNDIEEVKGFAKHFKERAEELYAENQKLKNLLNETITLADIMSDEINQNWCKESKLAVAKLNLIIEKAGYKRS